MRLRAATPGKLADAVHRVVIVKGQQKVIAGLERVGFANQLERLARIGGEDNRVLVGIRREEPEHASAAPLECVRARARCRTERVRIAEHVRHQQIGVPPNLRLGVEAAAGVVDVDLVETIEARELAGSQIVER